MIVVLHNDANNFIIGISQLSVFATGFRPNIWCFGLLLLGRVHILSIFCQTDRCKFRIICVYIFRTEPNLSEMDSQIFWNTDYTVSDV